MRQYGVFVASVALLSIAVLLALTPTALAIQSPEPREPITDTIKEQDQRLSREARGEQKGISPDVLVSQYRNLSISAFDQIYDYTCGPASAKEIMNYRGQTWWTLDQLITTLGTDPSTGTRINNMIAFLNSHPNPPPRNYTRRDTDYYPPSSSWQNNWFLALKNDFWNYYFPDFLQVNLSNFPGYYCAGFHYLVVKGFYQDLNRDTAT